MIDTINNILQPEIINDEELFPQVHTIVNQIKNIENKKPSPWGNISVLLITVILFFGSGIINNPVTDIFILIFILLIHEAGHLIAMKVYGYKDVKMFFIPFFGAAVSGKNDNICASKKAIISLSGPLPGILIGFVLVIFSVLSKDPLIYKIGSLFILLNGLNLLPLVPFDGGRFMNELFFIRNKYFEFIFKVVAITFFIIGAVQFEDIILGVIGISLILTIGTSYKLATIATEIKEKNDCKFEGNFLDQKNSIMNIIITELISKFPNPKGDHFYENLINDLWERIKYIPPKITSTIGLSFGYFTSLLLIISFFVLITSTH